LTNFGVAHGISMKCGLLAFYKL